MNLEASQSAGDWGRPSFVFAHAAIAEILNERRRNLAKWGEQNYPSIQPVLVPRADACRLYGIPTEAEAKASVEAFAKRGALTWTDVLIEEFAEAVAAPDETARRGELVQVAAVALAWIECIDRRAAKEGKS